MWNNWWIRVVFVLGLANAKQSCETPCSENQFPRCGTWLQQDNLGQASGIYFLDGSNINLSCSFSYLPAPKPVFWRFKENANSEWEPLKCSSIRTVTHCNFNEFKEHQVSSSCIVRVGNLTQSGLYQCASGGAVENLVSSAAAHIQVYGIENITQPELKVLWYRNSGEMKVTVCGNPKPEITWIHENSGEVISTHVHTRFAILPLHHYVIPYTTDSNDNSTDDDSFQPSKISSYCYTARLLISRIQESDTVFRVIASNTVESKEVLVKGHVFGKPMRRKAGAKAWSSAALLLISMLFTAFTY